MSGTTATTIQRPNGADVTDLQDGQGVSSRRLKKREIDRRCQRQARERTKTRIAYLEGLVEDFRRQDSSGQVATLMKQLQEVEAERDTMSKTLKDIQKAMDVHKPSRPDQEPAKQSTFSYNNPAQMIWDDNDVEEQKPSIISLEEATLATLNNHRPESLQQNDFELATFSPSPSVVLPAQEILFGPQVVRLDSDSPQSTSQALVQSKAVHDPTLMASAYAKNWDQPLNGCSCQNNHDDSIMPGRKSIWRGNYWRYANEVLSERFDWPEEVEPTCDAVADDVPVRAVLEGWDAVAKRGPLHPSWEILRRIDQTLFRSCPQTERLAILRAMHSLLQFHTQSTSDRYSRLPPWYNKRPAQKIAHSYAIDYFAWPGLRERFIFGEHDYCGNEFWHLFNKSLHVLWPYEFRDCYTREIETGLYKVSPHFDERLRDIKSWTMGPDIFQRFPELYCDIPSYNTIPANIISRSSRAQSLLLAAPPSTSEKQKITPVEKKKQARPKVQHQQHENHTAYSGSSVQMPGQNTPHFSNAGPYIMPQQNSMTPLDAFAYGAISEAEFAAMYHPEDLEGYPNIIF